MEERRRLSCCCDSKRSLMPLTCPGDTKLDLWIDRGVCVETGPCRIDNIEGEVGSVPLSFALRGRRLCEGDAFRGDGERRNPADDSVEGVRLKLTSPIFMVMLNGRAAVSAAMVEMLLLVLI